MAGNHDIERGTEDCTRDAVEGRTHAAGMSRRSFIGWGAVAALGAAGLASCSPAPKTQADADPKDASTQDGTASTNAQAASAPATAQAASGNPAFSWTTSSRRATTWTADAPWWSLRRAATAP